MQTVTELVGKTDNSNRNISSTKHWKKKRICITVLKLLTHNAKEISVLIT